MEGTSVLWHKPGPAQSSFLLKGSFSLATVAGSGGSGSQFKSWSLMHKWSWNHLSIGISGGLSWLDQFTIRLSPQQVSGGIVGFDLIRKGSGAHNITNYIIHQARWKEGRAPWDSGDDVIYQD